MPDPKSNSPAQHPTIDHEVQHDVSELLAELARMSQQISTQLDARAARLQDLIRQADQRIAQLSSLASTAASLPRNIDPPPAPPPHATNTRDAKPDDINAEIYTLADQGLSPHQIATHLDRPKGEIALILALRPSQS